MSTMLAIEQQIDRRTGRRIRRLRVEVTSERVIVHGLASSYHVKQLAIAAVQEVLATTGSALTADVRIRVDSLGCATPFPEAVLAS
jgi:hypothetical protein